MFLTGLIFLPTLSALILLYVRNDKLIRPMALGFALVEFLFSLGLLVKYNPNLPSLQLVEQLSWVPSVGISYFVGIDGISLWLVLLTTFLTPITILGSWSSIKKRVKSFHIAMLVLETTMLGSFLAFDAILFYIFFELSLIPMYFMIGVWGGPRRIYASVKFFIFTMFGSLFMLVGIIALMLMTQHTTGAMSASLLDFYKLDIPFVAGEFASAQSLLLNKVYRLTDHHACQLNHPESSNYSCFYYSQNAPGFAWTNR